jgi:hypothetical protein
LDLIINVTLIIYCLLLGGVYLLLINFLWEYLAKVLKLHQGIPDDMIEKMGLGWFVTNYIMEFLFYVAIPAIGYSFFYLILPFEGIRAGLAAGLFALIMGAVPIVMVISVRLKLPLAYLTFTLFGYFIKLSGALAIIGSLYIM